MEDEEFSDDYNDDLFDHFIHSIKTGNIEGAKYYFNKEFSNRTDKYGLQPIHWASLSYNVDILKWLLTGNCNIESASINGWRPIHFAAFAGDEEMVKCFIENYCKLDCPTDRGETISDVANGDCEHEFIDEILNETNLGVALSMRLKCGVDCDHKLCFTSVARGDFGKGELIGSGGFAKVYKVRESQSDRIFAVRTSWKHELRAPNPILLNINRNLTKLSHENIIKYYGTIETSTELKIFMECLEKESLEDEIGSTGSLSDDKIARYSKDILRAVAFLHHNKIVHRDINSSNILFDSNGRCKLSISHDSYCLANGKILTIKYLDMNYGTPEMINGEPYNYPFDIWSVGATVIHMLTGHTPNDGLQHYPPYLEWLPEALMFGIGGTEKLECAPPRPISNEMQQFIGDMTKWEPEERATADELLNYELIRNASINCEINNSNTDQSIIDYPIINRQRCTDLIKRTINNQQIGLSMGLKCPGGCNHKFCLSSVTANNFEKGKTIGKGSYGKVYLIKQSNSNPQLAVKKFEVKEEDNQKEARYLENEINEYRSTLAHENIVKYFGAITYPGKIIIFMEFIDGGSIANKITNNRYRPLPETTIKLYTKQILKVLKFLHGKKIIHRDIKSQNILLTKTECVKIADFGCSRFLQTISRHQQRTYCGTTYYLAPEVANDEPYDCPADIWSVGATVFEMATGRPPYYSIKNEIVVGIKIAQTRKLEDSSLMSNETKQFIDLMTKADPNKRLTADQLLDENYLK